MNSFAALAFFATLAFANAGLLAGPTATVQQGPSSRTTLVGPEGSVISAVAPGGQIVSEQNPGYAAHTAPVLAAPAVYAHSAYAAHGLVAAPGLIARHGLAANVILPAGHGLEGQYVHDYTETLFDDGSYKPQIYY